MIEKYKKITFIILAIITLSLSLVFIDIWILPKKEIDDTIVSFSKNIFKRKDRPIYTTYKFYTEKNIKFSTDNTYIQEDKVKIECTYLFENVTSVKTKTKDFTDKLNSGLSGPVLWITLGLIISSIISLLVLWYSENLTENSFLNIVIFNGLLLFFDIYFLGFNN